MQGDMGMAASLATHIRDSIDWDYALDLDLDLDFVQIVLQFPDVTEVDFEHALLRVATQLREAGRRIPDQVLLDQADAFDELVEEWIGGRLRSRS